ncbi:hypothetical protein HU200_010044 [Digitaria exilis]|uniref:Uncharacterized protein n=1 Tax=Digitaria exilis TaxID=1010633 RepID=A0A835FKV6_9POAL|nr:hypothetical protein HU200_010044 [Digitaria exilis]
MAALQSCRFASPATPFAVVSTSAKPPSMVAFAPPGHGFPAGTKTKLRQDRTVALRPCVVVRAQHHGGARPAAGKPAEYYFADERKHVMDRYHMIVSVDYGCLVRTSFSTKFQASAGFNVGAPNEISIDTVHRTIRAFVESFTNTADVSYNKRVRKHTGLRFLGALKGLASISHILLETALEALGPKASLSEYAFNCDIKAIHEEFNQGMSDIEDELRKASSPVEVCKTVIPVILEATKITKSFVGLMVDRRNRVLGKQKNPEQSSNE